MKPAFSVILFTVSSGAGLGLLVWLTVAGAVIVAASLAGLAGRERYAPGAVYKPAEVRDGQLIGPQAR